MKVALTGATGFVGSHVLTALHKRGHDVMALVRNDARVETVAAAGAMPAVVDLYDRPAVVGLLNDAEGAIHTASPGDATSANLDSSAPDRCRTDGGGRSRGGRARGSARIRR